MIVVPLIQSLVKEWQSQAAECGIRFMDAPVAGSKVKAGCRELIFLVGGEEADLQDVKPILESMGKQVLYQGKNGNGTAMKLVVNLTLAQSMAAFAEAVSFGGKQWESIKKRSLTHY